MINNNRGISKLSKSFISIITISSILYLTSCSFENTVDFPKLSTQNSYVTSQTSISKTSETTVASGVISICAPLSNECLQYLTLLYVGDTAGLFKDTEKNSQNGLNIPLNQIETYNVGLTANIVNASPNGISNEELLTLTAANSLPDIMLLNDLEQLKTSNLVPVEFNNDYLEKYLGPDYVYSTMFNNSINEQGIKALPYQSNVKMIYANTTLMNDDLGKSLLPNDYNLPYSSILSISKRITLAKSGIYGYMGLNDLLTFLPMTIDFSSKMYMWDGYSFDFKNKALETGVSEIKKLVSQGSVVDGIPANQYKTNYGSLDPKTLGKIGFWVDDSNNLEKYNLSNNKTIKRYIIQNNEKYIIPIKTNYIVVNKNSKLLNDSMRFAIFMSLDKNALLFRSRYPLNNGYIPPVSDIDVWANLVTPQYQGEDLMQLHDKMYYSKTITINNEETVIKAYDTIYSKYFNDILYGKKSLSKQIEQINSDANKLVSGD